jgi:hypothetical protein
MGWPSVCTHTRKVSFAPSSDLGNVDLSMLKDYSDLAIALEELFDCFSFEE